ncbi:hypothetical protein MAP00_003512 [Monascus purpureus]|nr:hypothetical protein MAP00_003512 [Monascus purpureus]
MTKIIDDKSQYCIPFILDRLCLHESKHKGKHESEIPPLFLGINGVQGAGKTVLVETLKYNLINTQKIPTTTLSLDDIYLTHTDQVALSANNAGNPLLQHRGQPSTHDVALGSEVFCSLREGRETRIPAYDKSLFNGEGDRCPVEEWGVVNSPSSSLPSETEGKEKRQGKIKLVLFEGWCVGFRALDNDSLRVLWEEAVRRRESSSSSSSSTEKYTGRLGYVKFEDVKVINDALKEYDVLTDALDAFIHIDADDLHYVYEWRQEQERSLRIAKGSGMSEEQVNQFVDGYYPSYELNTRTLREGVFKPPRNATHPDWQGRQLRLVVDKSRRVKNVIRI